MPGDLDVFEKWDERAGKVERLGAAEHGISRYLGRIRVIKREQMMDESDAESEPQAANQELPRGKSS